MGVTEGEHGVPWRARHRFFSGFAVSVLHHLVHLPLLTRQSGGLEEKPPR